MSQYGNFFGPYFPAFGLNTERYEVSVRIQSECGEIQTRKDSVFGHISHSLVFDQIQSLMLSSSGPLTFSKFSHDIFPCFRISAVRFVDQFYHNLLMEIIMPITMKMFKQLFLHTRLPCLELSAIRFIITPAEPKLICAFFSILFWACFICKQRK